MFDVLNNTVDAVKEEYREPGNVGSLSDILNVATNAIIAVTFAGSLVGVAYSLVLYILSKGDKTALQKAHSSMTWSVIILVLAIFVIGLKIIFFSLLGVGSGFNTDVPF